MPTATTEALQALWGRRVAQVRDEVGKSQTRLAHDAGLSRGQVWRIETGRSLPSEDAKLRIASALNTRVDVLFAWADTASAA